MGGFARDYGIYIFRGLYCYVPDFIKQILKAYLILWIDYLWVLMKYGPGLIAQSRLSLELYCPITDMYFPHVTCGEE